MRAALVKTSQVVKTQDPRWTPSHPIPWGGPWEKLNEDFGYHLTLQNWKIIQDTLCYFTWEAKFKHLLNEITTFHFTSVRCTRKWLVVERLLLYSASKYWQFWEDSHPLPSVNGTRWIVRNLSNPTSDHITPLLWTIQDFHPTSTHCPVLRDQLPPHPPAHSPQRHWSSCCSSNLPCQLLP